MSGLTHAYDEMIAEGFDAKHIARAWLTVLNASTSPSADPGYTKATGAYGRVYDCR
jgi:hypothetical protein